MKTRLTALSVVFATCAVPVLVSSTAYAQEECPPGSWFCEDAGGDVDVDDEADPADEPPPPERVDVPKRRTKRPPPIVVYQPEGEPPPTVVVVKERQAPEPPPQPKKPRWKREWGLNLRLQGVMMSKKDDNYTNGDGVDDRGMGGLGVGLRYRPKPHFAFEVGLDFFGGRDYQADEREETALTFNGLVFFNPKDKFQLYALGGFGFTGAHVKLDRSQALVNGSAEERDYSYFGLQAGLGLEWRLARKTALNFDIIGFVRGRTDDAAQYEYEYTDPETGRQTNSSGGGLARLGLTFYW
ncbi:MAG: porin family protein [Polyangiaceae bacterium]|nr:porin family protein [Myxococcales bacterium]MCB9588303.1 porin family protein [Polyangiaceae bacterium]